MTVKHAGHSVISVVLVLLSVVQLLISCSPLEPYRNLPEVTKWEPDIAEFDSLNRTESYPDDAIIFAGSSSIRLWKTLAGDMSPYSVIQHGYGGAQLIDYGVYADRIFSPHKCKALVLFNANDITGGSDDRSPEEVRKLFNEVYRIFRKSHPGVPVFFISMTPTRSRWKAWPEIRRCNELVKEWCEKNEIRTLSAPIQHFLISAESREKNFSLATGCTLMKRDIKSGPE